LVTEGDGSIAGREVTEGNGSIAGGRRERRSAAVCAALAALAALGVLAFAASAAAQSRRYPPEPVDSDAEEAARSRLWSTAIAPERHAYQALVLAASESLNRRTPDQTRQAIEKLDQAIALLPREPAAYRLRGDAHLELADWASCAADFAAADGARRRDDEPANAITELRRKLGVCQARAGQLSAAEKTLAETAASGNAPGEIWMRLGEVRIAMGKLDEAIAALGSALDSTEPGAQAMIRFLLATAYDRARRPADALVQASKAVQLDRRLAALQNPVIPALGPGELDYMLGLAHSAEPARPEHALAYFRRFVKAAPDSPWRKRADEHIRELRARELPESITPNGTARLELDAARAQVRRAMPQLRACLARFPEVVVEVEVTRAGPRTPSTDRMRPRFFTPPEGVAVRRAVGELSGGELDAVDACLQPIAARLALPALKTRDTYYRATFHVVAP
jgi:tetratricopeptide (TPR) repeat protein